ncbi:hypothetical protein VKT23_008608 [Stygiomarasmius scandens]|uniref:Uncharacterized protein n=1 Tax=Marasmiellus scandens TaxID=2682957 RepID=A0ABR1JJ75_9AGAR
MTADNIILPHLLKLRYIQDDELDHYLEEEICCYTISNMVATRFDPQEYTGENDTSVWQDSWPVGQLHMGLEVSHRALLDHYDFTEEETRILKNLERKGMPLEIIG